MLQPRSAPLRSLHCTGSCSGLVRSCDGQAGQRSVSDARQHRANITPPIRRLHHYQAGQLQWRHHRIGTAGEAKAQDIPRSHGTILIPRVDGLDVRQAVENLLNRLRLAPVSAPTRHLRLPSRRWYCLRRFRG